MKVKTRPKFICDYCTVEKEKKTYSQRFCSASCRNDWHNEQRCKLIEIGKKVLSGVENGTTN